MNKIPKGCINLGALETELKQVGISDLVDLLHGETLVYEVGKDKFYLLAVKGNNLDCNPYTRSVEIEVFDPVSGKTSYSLRRVSCLRNLHSSCLDSVRSFD